MYTAYNVWALHTTLYEMVRRICVESSTEIGFINLQTLWAWLMHFLFTKIGHYKEHNSCLVEEIKDSTFWILMLLSIIKVISSLLQVAIFCTITKCGVQKTTSHTTQHDLCLLVDGGYSAIYPLLTRLPPNGSPGAWGSYYLPAGDQNFKQGAWTGALNLWLSDQLPVNKQQNSLLILHFWNDNGKCLIISHMQKNTLANKR